MVHNPWSAAAVSLISALSNHKLLSFRRDRPQLPCKMTGEPRKEEAEVELRADPYVERGATIVSNPDDGTTYQQDDGTIWHQHTDPDSKKIYWFDHATGESSWTAPPESVALERGSAWQNPNKTSPDQLLRDAVTKSNEPWALWFYNNCKWTMHAFGPVVVGVAIPAHTYMCSKLFYSTSEYIWLEPVQVPRCLNLDAACLTVMFRAASLAVWYCRTGCLSLTGCVFHSVSLTLLLSGSLTGCL